MADDTDQTPQAQGPLELSDAVLPLLNQEDVDRAVSGARRREGSDSLSGLPPWIVPAIEREEIDDESLRSRLLGVSAEELQSGSKDLSTELSQEELDLLIATTAIAPRAALTEYVGERPAIEVELITDPVLRTALLGSDAKLETEESDAPDIDIGLFAHAGQDESAIAEAEAQQDERSGGEDSGLVGQAKIDALLAAASTPALQGSELRSESGGAIDQAEIDALLSSASAGPAPSRPPKASPSVVIDQGDIDSLISAGRLDNAPAEAQLGFVEGRDNALDQVELDALFAGATDEGGDMDESIAPLVDDQALLGDPVELTESLPGAAETVEAAFLEHDAATVGPADVAHYSAREAVGGENVDAAAPDGDLGMSQSALDELLARAKGKAKGEPEAAPIEEIN
ncbi:MAG: hypothetical protein AAB353_09775, partial [Candidatus Hydrogenedentota bacterium]